MDKKKFKELLKYSNPIEVQKKAFKLLGNEAHIYISSRHDKKYMIWDENKFNFVHFGHMGYEDFTKHKDLKRRQRYIARASKIKGNWKDNQYSPNNLSIILLW